MSDLIDKKALYNHFADLEAVALEQVKKHMHDEDLMEWRIWSTILAERTAYKHDVFDAPVVDAEPVKHGQWLDVLVADDDEGETDGIKCSVCGYTDINVYWAKTLSILWSKDGCSNAEKRWQCVGRGRDETD